MFTIKNIRKVEAARFPAIFNAKLRILARMLPYVISNHVAGIQAGCEAFQLGEKPDGDDVVHFRDCTDNLVESAGILTAEELQFLVLLVDRVEEAIKKLRKQTQNNSGTAIDTQYVQLSKEQGLHFQTRKNSLAILQHVWEQADTDSRIL